MSSVGSGCPRLYYVFGKDQKIQNKNEKITSKNIVGPITIADIEKSENKPEYFRKRL